MIFSTIVNLTAKVAATPHDFFIDARLPPSTTQGWEESGIVPEYVAPMLYKFIEKQFALPVENQIIAANFFSRAVAAGFEISESGKVIIPVGGVMETELSISSDEQKFVQYELHKQCKQD